ncbi:MAG: hypothetical protein Q4F24_11475 [Eubacteriales bacterium]|nr:hypothetical protein [Eubacteriales bacterium]
MNKMRILLMYANPYDMVDEKGKAVTGCTLNYFFWGESGETLKPVEGTTGAIGYQRAKCSIDLSLRYKMPKAPAVYDATFEMAVGSDGKPVLKVTDLDYVCDVDFRNKAAAK